MLNIKIGTHFHRTSPQSEISSLFILNLILDLLCDNILGKLEQLGWRVLEFIFITIFSHISGLIIHVRFLALLVDYLNVKSFEISTSCSNAKNSFVTITGHLNSFLVGNCSHSLDRVLLGVTVRHWILFLVFDFVLLVFKFILYSLLDFSNGIIGVRWKFFKFE